MSARKMALPPLKISEPYRLVWGLLCLMAGIILFASYPNLWLATLSGIWRGAGALLAVIAFGLWGLPPCQMRPC